MNLQTLLDKQRELDAHILENHPVKPNEDRLAKKILAFQVELGECANEWRGFKFWSDNQKPRTHQLIKIDTNSRRETNPLLEEFVDCVHFLLSIGLEIGIQKLALNENLSKPKMFGDKSINLRYSHLMSGAASLLNGTAHTLGDIYISLFGGLVKLGHQLGFTWEQVETAYFEKNAVNHQRQEVGY